MAWENPQVGAALAREGYDVVITPGQAYYLDMAQSPAWLEPGAGWAGSSTPGADLCLRRRGELPAGAPAALQRRAGLHLVRAFPHPGLFQRPRLPAPRRRRRGRLDAAGQKDWLRFAVQARTNPVLLRHPHAPHRRRRHPYRVLDLFARPDAAGGFPRPARRGRSPAPTISPSCRATMSTRAAAAARPRGARRAGGRRRPMPPSGPSFSIAWRRPAARRRLSRDAWRDPCRWHGRCRGRLDRRGARRRRAGRPGRRQL